MIQKKNRHFQAVRRLHSVKKFFRQIKDGVAQPILLKYFLENAYLILKAALPAFLNIEKSDVNLDLHYWPICTAD